MTTQQTEALQCAADLEYSIPRHRIQDAFILAAYKALKMIRTQHARITELESQLAQRFDAADVATASAQGFRDGVAKGQQAMWRHIETAPKDGSYLLLWEQYSDAPFVGYWSGGSWSVSHEHVDAEGGWDGANVVDALSMPITHWMPLPPAPGPADGESNG